MTISKIIQAAIVKPNGFDSAPFASSENYLSLEDMIFQRMLEVSTPSCIIRTYLLDGSNRGNYLRSYELARDKSIIHIGDYSIFKSFLRLSGQTARNSGWHDLVRDRIKEVEL